MQKYCFLFLLFFCVPYSALCYSSNGKENSDSITFKDRIGIHTNTLGWLSMTPNFALEYDLLRNDRRKVSLFLSGKYNWETKQKYDSRYVYDILGMKAEVRWYFRTRKRESWEKPMVSSTRGFFNRMLKSRRLLTAKNNPRLHRAYYMAPYVSYDKYRIKPGSTGYDGTMLSAGVSFGYTAPLYIYNSGAAIDFEIGASVGAAKVSYDKFEYDSDERTYVAKSGGKDAFLPYPILSDLRLSLVYRFKPIREQITAVNSEELEYSARMYELRTLYEENNARFVPNDTLSVLNKKVHNKNTLINRLNDAIMKHPGADSTMLLEQLRPAYRYVKLPRRMLANGSNIMLPNKEIKSVRELNVPYIDHLIEAHPYIVSGSGVLSVEERMLQNYNMLRTMLLNNNDTVSGISFFEFITASIPDINEFCVDAHNKVYLLGQKSTDDETSLVVRTYRSGEADKTGKVTVNPMPFMESRDTLWLNNAQSFNRMCVNDEIEARNLVKIAKIEAALDIIIDKEHFKIIKAEKASKNHDRLKKEKQELVWYVDVKNKEELVYSYVDD